MSKALAFGISTAIALIMDKIEFQIALTLKLRRISQNSQKIA